MDASDDIPLADWLARRCARPGGLSFADFMEAALYHPLWGYYASGRASIGRKGDFHTSVSVGPCFGQLLARRIAEWWRSGGSPASWALVEQGANDGRLMADILKSLVGLAIPAPDVFLVEPFSVLKARQETTLAPWGGRVTWVDSLVRLPSEAKGGVFVANELLDAFPVERVRFEEGKWRRLRVAATGGPSAPFAWSPGEVDCPALAAALARLPDQAYPDGYTTEIRLGLGAWARSLAHGAAPALALLCDYGFEADDYFHPARTGGTLRCYAAHRAGDDPLADPGRADLTAHVDWTEALRALRAAGFSASPPVDQGRWLTRVAGPFLLAIEEAGPPAAATRSWLRQFQTLVHPAHLGARFQVVEASGESAAARIPG